MKFETRNLEMSVTGYLKLTIFLSLEINKCLVSKKKKKRISLTVVLFTAAQRKKQPRGPLTDGWISKRWSVHTMIQYLVRELRSHKPRGTVKKKKKI